MSLSSIQPNLAAIINKAYSTDAGASTATASAAAVQSSEKAASPSKNGKAQDNTSASAQVTLGQSGNTTEIYTAQGLLQQMRQMQLSNSMLLFGSNEQDSDDSTGLLPMISDAEAETADEDWAGEISQNPEKAAVMVEKAKNASIKTMLGG